MRSHEEMDLAFESIARFDHAKYAVDSAQFQQALHSLRIDLNQTPNSVRCTTRPPKVQWLVCALLSSLKGPKTPL